LLEPTDDVTASIVQCIYRTRVQGQLPRFGELGLSYRERAGGQIDIAIF